MNVAQREAWQRAEDRTWRAMYVVAINVTILGVVGIVALMADQVTPRRVALIVPVGIAYATLAWGVGRRQSRLAATALVALAAVPLGTRMYRHDWGGAVISSLFLIVYGLALYGTIVLHRLRHLVHAEASGRASVPEVSNDR